LLILHGWGSKKQTGFYSFICEYLKLTKLRVKDTSSSQPNEALAEACYYLLKSKKIPTLFDAILIDEAQDLVSQNWLFEDKQPFFWLAYQSLKPQNSLNLQSKLLIYAYDEMQSLSQHNLLNPSQLFGDKIGKVLTGKYESTVNKTEVLNYSYRTPEKILNTAFAMNMGWLRPLGMLRIINDDDENIWQEIGYKITGKLQINEKVTISKIKTNYTYPLTKFWQDDLIEFKTFYSRQQELDYLAESILHNLRFDGLRPARNILVIILGNNYQAKELQNETKKVLTNKGIDVFIPNANYNNKNNNNYYQEYNSKFWQEGAVTISLISQAKGNEAEQVYLIGLDNIAKEEANLSLRNQIFIGLTRTKAWVNISGVGNYVMYKELKEVLKVDDHFSFKVLNLPQQQLKLTVKSELINSFLLGNRDFSQIDLSNLNLKNLSLININLIGSNLNNTNLENTDLSKAKLISANLSKSNLTNVNFYRANLSYANLQSANLSYANLQGANLRGANLQDAILHNINWQNSDLSDAILPKNFSPSFSNKQK